MTVYGLSVVMLYLWQIFKTVIGNLVSLLRYINGAGDNTLLSDLIFTSKIFCIKNFPVINVLNSRLRFYRPKVFGNYPINADFVVLKKLNGKRKICASNLKFDTTLLIGLGLRLIAKCEKKNRTG